VAVWASAFALPALAQNPYDPPTAVRPAPNLALLMNATRTVTINARSCGSSSCHAEPGGNDNWPLWQWGWTRIQLARRALTGGFAWNNGPLPPLPPGWTDPGEPDANISHDGIMDTYTGVRYGVFYFDGLGTRTVLNPGESYPGLTMNDSAQRAVIDFGAPIAPGRAPMRKMSACSLRVVTCPVMTIGDTSVTPGKPDARSAASSGIGVPPRNGPDRPFCTM
jgi:hypothetical protein